MHSYHASWVGTVGQVGQSDGMSSANAHGHPHWRIDIVCKMYAKPTSMLLLARVTFQICLFNPDSLFVFVLMRESPIYVGKPCRHTTALG